MQLQLFLRQRGLRLSKQKLSYLKGLRRRVNGFINEVKRVGKRAYIEDVLFIDIIWIMTSMKPYGLTVQHLQHLKLLPKSSPPALPTKSLDFSGFSSVPSHTSKPVFFALADHNFYYGTLVNRKAEGKECIYVFSDGAYYIGECKKGKFDGRGSLVKYGQDFKEKIFYYEGDWRDSKPHGKGKEQILNSMVYEGSFINGKKSGNGVMKYIDGSMYEGQFYNNEVQGEGTYTTKVHEWKGTWKEGYLQGQGQQISYGAPLQGPEENHQQQLDGNSVYKGGFLRGLKHGQGTYKWGKNFSEYSGTFSNGQLDGEGRFKIGDSQYKGQWKKGVQVSLQSTIQFKRVNAGSGMN